MSELQKARAATSSGSSTDAFVPLFAPLPTLAFFFFCLVSLVIQCERSGGYQSHCCLLQTSNPGALVHPSAPIIISARPPRKPRTLEEKYLISPLLQGSTVTQTIGGREEKEAGGLEEGGGGSEEEHQRDKTKAALDLVKRIPTSVLNTVPFSPPCTTNIYPLWE